MVQMKVEGGQPEVNLARASSMIDKAAGEGADLILLPEAMDLGWAHPSALSLAEEIPSGAACRMLQERAREHGVFICGGLVEKDGDRTYNAALLVSPEGEILVHHRKINVLDIAHEYYAQGRDLKVVETNFGSVGLMICADGFAHQRVISQTLCYMGADIIISPSSWALPPQMAHDSELATEIWYDHYAPVARKFGVHMAGCSNVGKLNDGPWKGFHAIGNSMVIDPDGHMAAGGLFGVDAEGIIYHDMMLRPRPVRGTDWLDYFNTQSGLGP
jgi:predicted amidohydrolase